MKKTGAGSKSADIRSYFKALSTSKATPSKPKEESTADTSHSTKRKPKPLVESDEDDFAKGSEDQRQQNGSASKPKIRSESSPKKKEKDTDVKPNAKPEKSKRDSSREQSGDRSSSSKSKTKRSADTEENPSKSKPSSSKSSPIKSVKESEEKTSKGSKKNTDDEISPAKSGKQSKSSSVDKVKRETTADSPSGRKKRSAKAMEDSDEDEGFNPMPPPSKKKTKNVRHEVTVTPAITPARKQPTTPETKTPVATPEEKKKQHTAGYFKFLSRPPPKQLGAKEIPEGAPNCLANLTFVITGVLPSFERDDIADAIKKYGGRVTGSVSKKTSYVIVGDEPGASKTKKAEDLGVPMMSEDDILDMIRKSNPNPPPASADRMEIGEDETDSAVESVPSKANISLFEKSAVEEPTSSKRSQATPKRKHADVQEFDSDLETPPKVRAQRGQAGSRTPSRRDSPAKSKELEPQARKSLNFTGADSPVTKESEIPEKAKKIRSPAKPQVSAPAVTKSQTVAFVKTTQAPAEPPLLWVDKYKPTSLKQIVGQGGDASNAKKLLKWLQNWFNYHGSADDKAKSNWPGLRDPEGKTFKAALLSGPPGVGKTTSAHLVCKELGYDFVELNASDQRNKNGLKLGFSDSLSNMSISAAAHGKANHEKARRHVLIMDEVDGMSGNEDRGGIQELIGLIKTSRVPIICICNDRQHPKIRSLANYCFDLRFTKPRYEQLKSFVQSICFKEKLKIPPEMLQQLIISTDQDVRQILHQLQLFKEAKEKSSYDPRKDLHLGPWEVIRKVFSAQDHKNMSINDKQSLFFHDYSLGPLFVQENYLRSVPNAANGDPFKTMDLIRAAAESLATGDRVEKIIRSNNNWSLLPVQALFSSVFPGEYMEGNGLSSIEFPQWLGKNSNRNKRARLLQELHTHMHLKISGSLEALNMDYLPYLRRAVVNPLVKGDPETAAEVMHDYCLLREDMEALTELAVWPNMKDLFERVDSKTKAAFTRLVNKEAFVPYSIVKITKGKGKAANGEEELEGLEGEEAEAKAEEEEEEDLEKDAMIKVKKPRGAKGGAKAGTSKSASQKSKGKRAAGSDLESDDEELHVKPKGRGKKSGAPSKSRKK